MEIEKILTETIKQVGRTFNENELAYLSLTSKIELPFRDKWAFELHKLLKPDIVVSREWKRTDLALIRDSKPMALIELKAMATFDALLPKQIYKFLNWMKDDVSKLNKLLSEETEVYTVLLACNPHSIIDKEYDGIIKYRTGINTALKKNKSHQYVKELALEKVEAIYGAYNCIAKGDIDAGSAFGVGSEILYWLFKI